MTQLVNNIQRLFRVRFRAIPRKVYRWCTATRRRKILSSILAILIVLTSIRFAFFKPKDTLAWWNDNWQYRVKTTITEQTGGSLTDFQVAMTLDTATLITAGKMKSDCADIRVYDSTNTQPQSFWVENCNNANTRIWLKQSFSASEVKVFYTYYGNPQAINVQVEGDNIFKFFDDFSGGIDSTVWTTSGTVTESDGVVTVNRSGSTSSIYTNSAFSFSEPFIVEVKYQHPTRYRNRVYLTTSSGGSSPTGYDYGIFDSSIYWNGFTGTNLSVNTWYTVQWIETNGNHTWKILNLDRTEVISRSHGSDIANAKFLSFSGTESDSSDFLLDYVFVREYASTEPTPSNGSEEHSPGPVAFYKFDEGYSAPESLPLTKNEQQINIVDQEFVTPIGDSSVYPTDNSLGIIKWDGTKYVGETVYFEAVVRSNVGSDFAHAALYTTGGSAVSGSDVSTTNGSYTRLRSGALTLTDGTEYTVRAYNNGGNAGRQAFLKSARLIIVQSDPSKITETETQVELGNSENTTNSSASQLTDRKLYYYDASKFSPAPTAYFEASIRAPQPTIEQQINIIDQTFSSTPGSSTPVPTDNSLGLILWDANKYPNATIYFEAVLTNNVGSDPGHAALYTEGGSAVSGADVQMNNPGTYVRVRSGALTLTDDTKYTVRAYASGGNGGRTATVKAARLIVVQSDSTKITDTETQIEAGNAQNNFSNTTYSTLTDHKIYYYDSTKFSGTVSTYFEATLHTDSGSDTVYAQLLECASSSDCSTGSAVGDVSHTGNTTWTHPTRASVTLTSGKYYAVQTKVSAGTGDIANAKIIIDQTAAGGITSLETVHQYINTPATDTDNVYTSQNFNNRYNPDLNESLKSFSGGTFTYYFDATIKTSAGTGFAQIYDKTNSVSISNSEISTINTSYTRVVSGDITGNLPQYPSTPARNLDTQVRNSVASGNTTSVSSSRLIIQVTNLATSTPTAYADLYNLTDTAQVSNSEVSSSSNSWSLVRSSEITLATGKQYVLRLRSSASGVGIKIASAKIILDQTDSSGIKAVETVQQYINTAVSRTSASYADQDYLNQFNPDNFHINQTSIFFETTMKTSTGGGANDAFAIFTVDGGSTVSGSEISTDQTSYTRVTSASSITSAMPTSASNMDTQIKNESAGTTTVSNSWLVIQNGRSYDSVTHDSTQNQLHGNVSGITWKVGAECHSENCLSFDGTNDYVKVYDDPKLDFAAAADFTLTGWFKHPTASGTDTILAKYESTGSDGGYKVYMNSSGQIVFGVDDDNTFGPDDAATSSQSYADNSWHHFAALKDGTSSIELYIDGVRVGRDASIAATGTLVNNDHLYIGIDGDGTNNPWEGSLDEIKVYPYLRTADEIKTDFALGSAARGTSVVFGLKDESFLTNGLVGYWKLDENSGNASDASGYGNILTNNGTTTYVGGKFGNGSEHVPASSQYFSTGTINGVKTVSFWVNPDSTTNYYISLTSGAYITSSGTISVTGFTDPKVYVNGVATTAITQDVWQLVTVTTETAINANQFYVGRQDTNYFDGTMDEVRLYNRVLSPAEINKLYNWAPGPVGWWKMDEGSWSGNVAVNDSSGNLNSLTHKGNASIINGKYGNGGTFDGTGDYLCSDSNSDGTCDDDGDLDVGTGSFSLEGWFKHAPITTDPDYLVVKAQAGTNAGYKVYMANDGDIVFEIDDDSIWGPDYSVTTTAATYDDGAWHHFAAVRNADSAITITIDGVQIASTAIAATATLSNDDPFYIGVDDNASSNPWDGQLDDIKLYNYTRTQAQIVEDMNAGHPAPGSPIGSALAEWRFDEGYGDTANNSGNTSSYDGDLAGSGTACPAAGDNACPTWTNSGKFGKALDFEDSGTTDDYVDAGDINELDGATAFTLSAWANMESQTAYHTISGKSNSVTNKITMQTGLAGDGGGSNDPYLAISNGSSTFAYTTSNILSTGVWNHWVMVYDGTLSGNSNRLKFYLNGVQQHLSFSGTIPATSGSNANSVRIGNEEGCANCAFDGQIDDAKIYSFALTPDQIKILYNQGQSAVFGATSTDSSGTGTWSSENEYCPPGQGSTCTPPVAEYLLNEKSGSNAFDTSENNFTGTITGSTWKHAAACHSGSCLEMNGSSDYIDVGTGPSAVRAIEFWTYPQTTSEYFINLTGTTDYIQAASGTLDFVGDASETIYVNGIQTTTLAAGQWQHVVVVTSANENASNLDIGRTQDANYLEGKIDQVRLYSNALTQAQVAWLYNRGGPVGHWKFDECTGATANDSSGNSLNGTISAGSTGGTNDATGTCNSGDSTEMWNNGTTGKRNASLDFDGDNSPATDADYVEVSDNDLLDIGNAQVFSIEAWVNRDTFDSFDTIVAKKNDSTQIGLGYILLIHASDIVQFLLGDGSSGVFVSSGSVTITSSGWNHIVVSLNSDDSCTLYLNAKAVGSCVGSTANPGNTLDLRIGSESDGGEPFDGKIDNVRLYRYPLTLKQVIDRYNQGAVMFGPNTGP